MSSESQSRKANEPPPPHQCGADAGDLVLAALDFLRGVSQTGGATLGTPPTSRQKEALREWAIGLGLMLNAEEFIPHFTRGGMEHDWYRDGERVMKMTRNGVFGLSPGIELALVSLSQDARRFHLWEASPLEYLERLHLQNLLVPRFQFSRLGKMRCGSWGRGMKV